MIDLDIVLDVSPDSCFCAKDLTMVDPISDAENATICQCHKLPVLSCAEYMMVLRERVKIGVPNAVRVLAFDSLNFTVIVETFVSNKPMSYQIAFEEGLVRMRNGHKGHRPMCGLCANFKTKDQTREGKIYGRCIHHRAHRYYTSLCTSGYRIKDF